VSTDDKPADSAHKPGAQHHDKSPEELAKEAAAKRRDEILQKVLHAKKNQAHNQHLPHQGGMKGGGKGFSPAPIRRGPRGG
jgi:hypothetical protein